METAGKILVAWIVFITIFMGEFTGFWSQIYYCWYQLKELSTSTSLGPVSHECHLNSHSVKQSGLCPTGIFSVTLSQYSVYRVLVESVISGARLAGLRFYGPVHTNGKVFDTLLKFPMSPFPHLVSGRGRRG